RLQFHGVSDRGRRDVLPGDLQRYSLDRGVTAMAHSFLSQARQCVVMQAGSVLAAVRPGVDRAGSLYPVPA
ncbi:MAG: hypothetical protein ABF665_19430, partial [Gluconacetobacter sp.]